LHRRGQETAGALLLAAAGALVVAAYVMAAVLAMAGLGMLLLF